MKLKYQLPELYQGLVESELLNFSVTETKANCGDCSMSRENRGPRAKVVYDKELKCCTFDPFLPNYLVGALLSDERTTKSGVQSLEKKMLLKEETLPIGLRPSTDFQRQFLRKKENDFGNREEWLCPYFDHQNQNCGIWRNRGNVCTSFYCFSNAGQTGIRFWTELGNYLHLVESTLMEEALVHLDFSPRQLSEMLIYISPSDHLKARKVPLIGDKDWVRIWNHYPDPTEFYIKTYQFVKNLKAKDLREALGETGERAFESLQKQMQRMRDRRTT